MSAWDVSQTLAKKNLVEKLKVCPRHFEYTQMWDIAHMYHYVLVIDDVRLYAPVGST